MQVTEVAQTWEQRNDLIVCGEGDVDVVVVRVVGKPKNWTRSRRHRSRSQQLGGPRSEEQTVRTVLLHLPCAAVSRARSHAWAPGSCQRVRPRGPLVGPIMCITRRLHGILLQLAWNQTLKALSFTSSLRVQGLHGVISHGLSQLRALPR